MAKKCPICWTKEDGPYPCAFKNGIGDCAKTTGYDLASECIPMHMPRYLEYIKPVVSKCPDCGVEVENTAGDLKRGLFPLCYFCNEKREESRSLAEHVRGDI